MVPITPGTRLGRYEVRSKRGAGGMAEVYLAEDTQLRRQVDRHSLVCRLGVMTETLHACCSHRERVCWRRPVS